MLLWRVLWRAVGGHTHRAAPLLASLNTRRIYFFGVGEDEKWHDVRVPKWGSKKTRSMRAG